MRKIQKFSELQPTIGFTEFDIYRDYQKSFVHTELGKIHALFPFAALAKEWGLCEHSLGRHAYFSAEGKIALMVLKAYTALSDSALTAQLNSNIHYQLFCGIRINPLHPLINYKIVSDIRCKLGRTLVIDRLQQVLASHWKPYLEHVSVLMTDATCYETSMRYPTDVKILWESVSWIYHQLHLVVKRLKGRMPRSKYDKQHKHYYAYSRKRKRSHSETRVLQRSLLHLLNKLTGALEDTVKHNRSRLAISAHFYKRLAVIKKVYQQQQVRFFGGEVKDLIVSIDKSYIRPIVRGKERKRVEFGAKVNMLQVEGINFIEHLSFSAFHEGIRIPQCIAGQQALFHKRVTHLAADRIYATNYNRTYCSSRHITTSFIRKGRAGKDEAQAVIMRKLLTKERGTRLEGSFGTEKQYYSLDCIKARSRLTETLWIFFGIHTANAVRTISKKERSHFGAKEMVA